jgi:hypothetical protein
MPPVYQDTFASDDEQPHFSADSATYYGGGEGRHHRTYSFVRTWFLHSAASC